MPRAQKVTVVASLALIACMSASVLLLGRVDRARPQATLDEVLYLPSPKVLKDMSLGYEGLLADIYWTRAVQYFGGHLTMDAPTFKLLAPLLNIATQLDPHLVVAYDFGANFLAPPPPNGAGDPKEAIRLTNFGIQNNPQEWRLYYNLGFVYYIELKDYAAAADAFSRGANIPGAHPFMRVLAARCAEHAGELDTARMLWIATYQSSKNKEIRANAMAHLRALKVDDDIGHLDVLIAQFHNRTGRFPSSFAELQIPGLDGRTPVDPIGDPYKLTQDGRVELEHPEDFTFAEKGLPLGYKPSALAKFLPSDYN